MKRIRIGLFFVSVVILFICFTFPAWAYKFTVTNKMDSTIEAKVFWGLNANHHDFGQINPGETKSYSNTDWHTVGLCFEMVKINTFFVRCVNKWIERPLLQCGDIHINVKRWGECDIDI